MGNVDFGINLSANGAESAKSAIEALTAAAQGLQAGAEKMLVTLDRLAEKSAEAPKTAKKGVDAWSLSIEQLEARYKRLQDLTQRAVGTNQFKKLNAELNQTKRALDAANKAMGNVSATSGQVSRKVASDWSRLTSVFNKLGAVMGVSFGLYGAFRIGKSVIQSITEYELAMKKLESVTNSSTSQMMRFQKVAITVGTSSIFGAKGVSELMLQLAKMGFAPEMIEKMAQGIVNLATATQEDLGKTAETVANVMKVWNLTGEETVRVTDTIAQGMNKTALDLERFRQSIKYIAPIAAGMNISLEETTALLGVLADRGLYGSLAGTTLRNVFLKFADANSEVVKRTGITVRSFDDMVKIFKKLKEEGTDISEMFELIDRRAISGLQALIEAPEELNKLTAAFRRTGEAQRMADVNLTSLSYKTQMLVESWKAFWSNMDDGSGVLASTMKGVVEIVTAFLNVLTRTESKKELFQAQKREVDLLVSSYLDVNVATERREEILDKLIDQFPQYFGSLDKEKDVVEQLTAAYEKYSSRAERSILLLGIQKEVDELDEKIRDANKNIVAFRDQWTKKGEIQYTFFDEQQKMLITAVTNNAQIAQQELNKLFKIQDDLIEQRDRVVEKYQQTEASIFSTQELVNAQNIKNELEKYKGSISSITQGFIDAGMASDKAFGKAFDGQLDQISGRLTDLHERNKQLEQEYEKQRKTNPFAVISPEVSKNKVLIEELIVVWTTLFGLQKKLASEFVPPTSPELLRLLQKEEELRIKITYDGIEERKRLAKNEYDYTLKIAKAEKKAGEELRRIESIAQKEYDLKMQEITRDEVRQNNRRMQDMLRIEEQIAASRVGLSDEMIRATTGGFEREAALLDKKYKDDEARVERSVVNQILELKRLAQISDEEAEKSQEKIELLIKNYEEYLKLSGAKRTNETTELSKQIFLAEQKLTEDLIALSNEENLAILEGEKIVFEAKQNTARAIYEKERYFTQRRLELERDLLAATMKNKQDTLNVMLLDPATDPILIEQIRIEIEKLAIALGLVQAKIDNPPKDTGWLITFNEVMDGVNTIIAPLDNLVNEWVSATDAIVSEIERQMSAAESALQTELQLAEQGYASNVSLKRKELAELKKAREKALKDQERATRMQLHLDSLQQASSLITAGAKFFEKSASFGIPGFAWAISVIATMYSQMKKYSLMSKQFAVKYETGGYGVLGGNRHTGGGVNLGVLGEGERGEAWGILNRKASMRYGDLFHEFVEQANIGKLDLSAIPKFDNVNVSTKVSLDDSKDLKAIRKALTKKSDTSQYGDGFRVVKRGGIVERYWTN